MTPFLKSAMAWAEAQREARLQATRGSRLTQPDVRRRAPPVQRCECGRPAVKEYPSEHQWVCAECDAMAKGGRITKMEAAVRMARARDYVTPEIVKEELDLPTRGAATAILRRLLKLGVLRRSRRGEYHPAEVES